MRLVLASGSPRRRELLAAAGFSFDVTPVDVDETLQPDEDATSYVTRLAKAKALGAAPSHADRVVIGADTAVVVDGEVLGKPRGAEDATRMLRLLSGRAHEVLTGIAVFARGRIVTAVERTTVWFVPLSDSEISWYVASGEPLDKAGAYAIQALASRFVPRIDGSYANVVGLPVTTVVRLLAKLGLDGSKTMEAPPG